MCVTCEGDDVMDGCGRDGSCVARAEEYPVTLCNLYLILPQHGAIQSKGGTQLHDFATLGFEVCDLLFSGGVIEYNARDHTSLHPLFLILPAS